MAQKKFSTWAHPAKSVRNALRWACFQEYLDAGGALAEQTESKQRQTETDRDRQRQTETDRDK